MKLRNSFHCVPLLACLALPAFAQSSGDVSVTGTLLPGPCTIALANSGIADFGTIDTGILNDTGKLKIPVEPSVALDVTCSSSRLIAMSILDNRADSTLLDLSGPGGPATQWFGFGLTPTGQRIGMYRVWTDTPVLNGGGAETLQSIDGVTWGVKSWGWDRENDAGSHKYRAWGTVANAITPVTTASWQLTLEAFVAGRSELQLTGDTPLDGSAIIQINYL